MFAYQAYWTKMTFPRPSSTARRDWFFFSFFAVTVHLQLFCFASKTALEDEHYRSFIRLYRYFRVDKYRSRAACITLSESGSHS